MRSLSITTMLAFGLLLAPAAPAKGGEAAVVDVFICHAVDTSASVTPSELWLMREGTADAIESQQTLDSIAVGLNHRIAVTYVEWSTTIVANTWIKPHIISDAASAKRFAKRVRGLQGRGSGATNIGAAIAYCLDLFDNQIGIHPARYVIDLVGDGTNNMNNSLLSEMREEAQNRGVTINVLARLSLSDGRYPEHQNPSGGLVAWYETHVTTGLNAFVVSCVDLGSFTETLLRKFNQELMG